MASSNHIFSKNFWNKSRVIWGMIIGICTCLPMVGGSFYAVTTWTEANVVCPYVTKKADSISMKNQEPLRQDIKTMISDVKFTRRCIEEIVPERIKAKVTSDMIVDSLENIKYKTR
jgi:hypothetical protein